MDPTTPRSRPPASRARAARVLGIAPDASEAEVRRAYRSLALRFHPDRHPAGSTAQRRAEADWLEIRAAYDTWRESATTGGATGGAVPLAPGLGGRRVSGRSPIDRAFPDRAVGTGDRVEPEEERRTARGPWLVAACVFAPLLALAAWGGTRLLLANLRIDSEDRAASSPPTGSASVRRPAGSSSATFEGEPPAASVPAQPPAVPSASGPSASGPSASDPGPSGAAPSPERGAVSAGRESTRGFGPGDSEGTVLEVQGEPARRVGHVWWYGSARVRFRAGRVIGWDDPGLGTLRVRVEESRVLRRGARIASDATRAQVAASLGPPDSLNGPIWRYGPSWIRFRGDRIARFRSHPSRPLPVVLDER